MWVAWGDGPARIVPDGHADLVWSGRRLLVAGYDTTPQWVDRAAAPVSLGVRLRPGQLPVLARLPASELLDQRIPLDEILGVSTTRPLEERMSHAADPGAELDELAAQLLAHDESTTVAETTAVRDRLASGATVASVAGELGWSERRLHRFCVERYGFGPKLLQRSSGSVMRMNCSVRVRPLPPPPPGVASLTRPTFIEPFDASRTPRLAANCHTATSMRPRPDRRLERIGQPPASETATEQVR